MTLSINTGAYFNTVLDDVYEIQADVDLLANWADNASEQMKVYVDTLILAITSIGNNAKVTSGKANGNNQGYQAGRLSASLNLGSSTNSIV